MLEILIVDKNYAMIKKLKALIPCKMICWRNTARGYWKTYRKSI